MKNFKQSFCLLISFFLIISFILSANAINIEYQTWKQSDSRWGSITFGSVGDTISSSGCAITSIAILMVHSGAVSDDPSIFNPGIFCEFLKSPEINGFTNQGWLYWSAVSKYTNKFTYDSVIDLSGSVSEKTSTIKNYIDLGYVVVAMVKNGGHYVAVNKVQDGTVYIFDPAMSGYTQLFQYDASGITKLRLFKGPSTGPVEEPINQIVDSPELAKKSESGFYTGKYVITSDNGVNIRTGPGTNYDKLSFGVPYNINVTVTDVVANWGLISYSGSQGWICLDYAKRTSPVINGISLTLPSRTSFHISETPDFMDLAVFANYDDGNSVQFTGYKVLYNNLLIGDNIITVSYGSYSASFTISVYGERPLGDADGNYQLSSNDALCVLQYSLKKITADNINLSYSDVNGDNIIDATDALLILQYIVNKIPSFPASSPNTSF